jgi:hypothetical protein
MFSLLRERLSGLRQPIKRLKESKNVKSAHLKPRNQDERPIRANRDLNAKSRRKHWRQWLMNQSE